MKFLRFLFFLLITSLILGQLTRIEFRFFPIAVYFHDLILTVLIFSSIIFFLALKRRFFLPKISLVFLIFTLVAIVSLLNLLRFFPFSQILVGNLFLIRFVALFALYPIFLNLVSAKQLRFWINLLIFTGVFLSLLGFFQLIFFYDLSFLQNYGYDPHVGRLVSTFLDPNFFGGFTVMILNLVLASYFESKEKKFIAIGVILFFAIILTFSRSTYLALFTSIFLFGILKSRRLAIAVFSAFILLTPAIPRILERILGAVTFDMTASARIASWVQALQVFFTSPVLGVGFNNLRFAKSNLGFFEISQGLGGHSGAGVDSSFLLVLATTGVLGLFVFLFMYANLVFKSFIARSNPYSLATFVSLVALFVHSQFVNSLFFPWIAATLWVKIAISDVSKTS